MVIDAYAHIGPPRFPHIDDYRIAMAEAGIGDCYYKQFGGVFGFWEAFRVPEDEEKYPRGKVMLPTSEWTVERLDRCDYMYSGTVADIRRKMDHLVEQANPDLVERRL